ncbi:MAG: hypothetical protein MI784_09125 [Cytophagales bacterium]|nr:hypothetical protein [Cytophagales bacterium]
MFFNPQNNSFKKKKNNLHSHKTPVPSRPTPIQAYFSTKNVTETSVEYSGKEHRLQINALEEINPTVTTGDTLEIEEAHLVNLAKVGVYTEQQNGEQSNMHYLIADDFSIALLDIPPPYRAKTFFAQKELIDSANQILKKQHALIVIVLTGNTLTINKEHCLLEASVALVDSEIKKTSMIRDDEEKGKTIADNIKMPFRGSGSDATRYMFGFTDMIRHQTPFAIRLSKELGVIEEADLTGLQQKGIEGDFGGIQNITRLLNKRSLTGTYAKTKTLLRKPISKADAEKDQADYKKKFSKLRTGATQPENVLGVNMLAHPEVGEVIVTFMRSVDPVDIANFEQGNYHGAVVISSKNGRDYICLSIRRRMDLEIQQLKHYYGRASIDTTGWTYHDLLTNISLMTDTSEGERAYAQYNKARSMNTIPQRQAFFRMYGSRPGQTYHERQSGPYFHVPAPLTVALTPLFDDVEWEKRTPEVPFPPFADIPSTPEIPIDETIITDVMESLTDIACNVSVRSSLSGASAVEAELEGIEKFKTKLLEMGETQPEQPLLVHDWSDLDAYNTLTESFRPEPATPGASLAVSESECEEGMFGDSSINKFDTSYSPDLPESELLIDNINSISKRKSTGIVWDSSYKPQSRTFGKIPKLGESKFAESPPSSTLGFGARISSSPAVALTLSPAPLSHQTATSSGSTAMLDWLFAPSSYQETLRPESTKPPATPLPRVVRRKSFINHELLDQLIAAANLTEIAKEDEFLKWISFAVKKYDDALKLEKENRITMQELIVYLNEIETKIILWHTINPYIQSALVVKHPQQKLTRPIFQFLDEIQKERQSLIKYLIQEEENLPVSDETHLQKINEIWFQIVQTQDMFLSEVSPENRLVLLEAFAQLLSFTEGIQLLERFFCEDVIDHITFKENYLDADKTNEDFLVSAQSGLLNQQTEQVSCAITIYLPDPLHLKQSSRFTAASHPFATKDIHVRTSKFDDYEIVDFSDLPSARKSEPRIDVSTSLINPFYIRLARALAFALAIFNRKDTDPIPVAPREDHSTWSAGIIREIEENIEPLFRKRNFLSLRESSISHSAYKKGGWYGDNATDNRHNYLEARDIFFQPK